MGVYSPITGPILEGSRGYIPYHHRADLDLTIRWPRWRRRDFPFRPYLHARIPRITVAEQLPQIIIINITAAEAVDRELGYKD